jgi:hypothetical protein
MKYFIVYIDVVVHQFICPSKQTGLPDSYPGSYYPF